MRTTATLALAASAYALQMPASVPRATAPLRAPPALMDETIIQKALAGELEEEGAENVFLSEVGWATYLDQEAKSSYNLNQRPSMADDGYFTADVFSSPLDVLADWKDAVVGAISAPLETAFPTITNDESGNRMFPKGLDEVKARTIKPKDKDFDANKRIVGIPGFNAFGSPSSKQEGNFLADLFNRGE